MNESEDKGKSPVLLKKDKCCGCGVCVSMCPVDAIFMETNDEGFLYPQIDGKRCIKCCKCISVCAFKSELDCSSENNIASEEQTQIFATRCNDNDVLCQSASGGMFTVISDWFIQKHYAIACTTYNYEKHEAEFRLINDKVERDKARRSMYIQSNPHKIYKECLEWLATNPDKELLFLGTGCQAAGFAVLAEEKGVRHRCLIVDIICHGVPSPGVWKDYINSIKKDRKVECVNFKDKRNGWLNPTAIIKVGGREISLKDYVMTFNKGYTLRPSCYKCPYTQIHRCTDLTIGDYWHIEEKQPDFYNDMGNSLLLIHTKKGREFFEIIKKHLQYRDSNCSDCWQYNLERPTPEPKDRKHFWTMYKLCGAGVAIKIFGSLPISFRVKVFIKKYLISIKNKLTRGICYGKKL